jgi:hypothetical protein
MLLKPEAAVEKRKRDVIWSGLRIGMGICSGSCISISPCKRTGRAEYFGQGPVTARPHAEM